VSVQTLYNWLRNFKISIDDKDIDVQLKDYFEDLTTLQNSLVQVKGMADDMGDANRQLNKERIEMGNENSNMKDNLERKDKRIVKMKSTIDTYKSDIVKLISSVERELEKLKNLGTEDAGKRIVELQGRVKRASDQFVQDDFNGLQMSPMQSPTRNSRKEESVMERDNIWFDIEKSQERYEALLDSYQNIIKDKDLYLKQMEEEIASGKKEMYNLEDANFNMVREKDRKINELSSDNDDLQSKLKKLQTKTDEKVESLKDEIRRNKLNYDEMTAQKEEWSTERRIFTEKVNSLHNDLKELDRAKIEQAANDRQTLADAAAAHRADLADSEKSQRALKDESEKIQRTLKDEIRDLKDATRDLKDKSDDLRAQLNDEKRDHGLDVERMQAALDRRQFEIDVRIFFG
jgi:chromosome segregation ATPase